MCPFLPLCLLEQALTFTPYLGFQERVLLCELSDAARLLILNRRLGAQNDHPSVSSDYNYADMLLCVLCRWPRCTGNVHRVGKRLLARTRSPRRSLSGDTSAYFQMPSQASL